MAKEKVNFTEKMWDENTPNQTDEWASLEGQLAIDAYQTDSEVILKAPVAGVKPEDIDVSISNNEIVTIKGQRKEESQVEKDDYLLQEVYWGAFSRSYILPVAVDGEKAQAAIKDGVLTVTIPKAERAKTKSIKVKAG